MTRRGQDKTIFKFVLSLKKNSNPLIHDKTYLIMKFLKEKLY